VNKVRSVETGLGPQVIKMSHAPTWQSSPVVLGSIVSVVVGLLVSPRSPGTTEFVRLLDHRFVVAHGAMTPFAFMATFFIGLWVPGWVIFSAIRTPKSTFASVGRSKSRWVAFLVIVVLIGDASLWLVPIYFLVRVRPQLAAEHRRSQP
jgi:hypothetical protein